jgi:thiol-disulfide isomerase/thioredoxin
MKNGTPWIIALAAAGYLAISIVSNEYASIRSAIGETKQKADSVADETKATMESIKQTIEDLRSKFVLLETQMTAKQVKTVEQPKQATKPTIVMYSASWCGPCQKWKRESMQQWKAIGWDVSVIENDSTNETVPRFEITDSDGLKFRSIGYLTRETFARDRLQALQKRN